MEVNNSGKKMISDNSVLMDLNKLVNEFPVELYFYLELGLNMGVRRNQLERMRNEDSRGIKSLTYHLLVMCYESNITFYEKLYRSMENMGYETKFLAFLETSNGLKQLSIK